MSTHLFAGWRLTAVMLPGKGSHAPGERRHDAIPHAGIEVWAHCRLIILQGTWALEADERVSRKCNKPQSLVLVCTCLVSMKQHIGECSAINSFAICILVGEVTPVYRESYRMTSAAMSDGGEATVTQ